MKRVGLGRHGLIDENAGDPLDGLVNLFDLGMVLAVAFLIAGLSLTLDVKSGKSKPRDPAARSGRVLPSPTSRPERKRPRRAGRAGIPAARRQADLRQGRRRAR